MGALYDRIGRTYATTRRPDPRIQAAIFAALGDAETVVNVGAGTGSYEPPQTVLAVEPSAVMIAQRPPGSAPAVQATAEQIPLADGACDAALASLTIHHWPDRPRGLAEMRRVARRVVVFTVDPAYLRRSGSVVTTCRREPTAIWPGSSRSSRCANGWAETWR